jgi:hypothetical protein
LQFADFQQLPGLSVNGTPHWTFPSGSCHGNPRIAKKAQSRSRTKDFEHGRAERIFQQSIRPLCGVIVHRAAHRNAIARPPGAPVVLDRHAHGG